MATGTIIRTYETADQTQICTSVRVNEAGPKGTVEYLVCIPNTPEFAGMTTPDKRSALQSAVKAHRDAQQVPTETDLPSLATGTMTL